MNLADTPWRSGVMRRRVLPPAVVRSRIAVGLLSAAAWSSVAAVGLGPVTQQSALGQSLRIVVPVVESPGDEIRAECFKLAPAEREADGIPQQVFGRVSLERTASGAQLVITNARPVNDPVLRVTVQAGCTTAVRREYVLLLDPPPIETPLVAADATAPVEVATTPPPPPVAAPARPRTSRATRDSGSRTVARGTGEPAAQPRKAAPPKPRVAAKAPPKRTPPAKGDQPRLSVSSGAPTILRGRDARAASEAEQARMQQDLANAIEAETVVLRQRIAELTALVERMQEEVRANDAAERAAEEAAKAKRAAEEKAKAEPLAKAGAWWDANWQLLLAIVGIPVLIAAGLLWRRRQQGERAADWQAAGAASLGPTTVAEPTRTQTMAGAAATLAMPTTVAASSPAATPAPAKKTTKRGSGARDGANALAVSELLHVTEEARVFVALGHPERAIDVLNEHIKHVPRSMPAAWLMLLDLYHATGKRQDFRRLAEEFHLHCNVLAPLWEGFRAAEADEGGLETFPHIVREVVGMWRRPECRDYLERLLYDNREGRRIGFPLAAYGDILLLLQILDAPQAVDIDSDLAGAGKLDRPPPQRRPPAATPAQRPLLLDLDENILERAKKPPTS